MTLNPDQKLPALRIESKNCFVFVVCGAGEYIDCLHYALKALRRHSRNDIVVLTDTSRNEIAIDWPKIVDVKTPDAHNNHQASIYLKTAIHRYLPIGPTYCYLDTDVVALNSDVDQIFAHKTNPVIFAPDQGRTHNFSSNAVRCNCSETRTTMQEEINALKTRMWNVRPETPEEEHLRVTETDFESLRANPVHYWTTYFKFLATPPSVSNRHDPLVDRWRAFWFETQVNTVRYERASVIAEIERTSKWRWDRVRCSWITPAGLDMVDYHCDHLVEAIQTKFNIRVAAPRWQNWNGGVFLFDESGHKFLDAWHNKTMKIFQDRAWKTRDQGTLIATCWEFGLQNAKTLPRKFNFILDSGDKRTLLARDGRHVTVDAFVTRYVPAFAHVFYRFGDKDWDMWNWVARQAE